MKVIHNKVWITIYTDTVKKNQITGFWMFYFWHAFLKWRPPRVPKMDTLIVVYLFVFLFCYLSKNLSLYCLLYVTMNICFYIATGPRKQTTLQNVWPRINSVMNQFIKHWPAYSTFVCPIALLLEYCKWYRHWYTYNCAYLSLSLHIYTNAYIATNKQEHMYDQRT